jgi:hypothetical protein
MSSIKHIHANRLNALKSTGPKTPEGKTVVSLTGPPSDWRCESRAKFYGTLTDGQKARFNRSADDLNFRG